MTTGAPSLFQYDPVALPAEAEALRDEVRHFLAKTLADLPPERRAQTWDGFDVEFSRKVGARGWIGMTWPRRYGGGERSALERYVMLEEMLAAGAPVSAHWFADRQSGPLLLRYGSEAQRMEFLPRMARGELSVAIGLSEPDAGSDVAALRTRGIQHGDDWIVNGAKVWTSNAHRAQFIVALVRTRPQAEQRHAGLSQFLIDMHSPGITVRPIIDLAGRKHFNEIAFEDVRVPGAALIGREGEGWEQVMAELAFERSGPERYLSSLQILIQLVAAARESSDASAIEAIGRAVAELATLRQLSLSIAGMLEAGRAPGLEAALVKDLGTAFEQSLPELLHAVLGVEPDAFGDRVQRVQATLLLLSPSFSIRGGTREILRGIIARGLGLR